MQHTTPPSTIETRRRPRPAHWLLGLLAMILFTASWTAAQTAGVTVSAPQTLVTTEAGGPAEFTVVLDSQPAENVTIGVSSSDEGEGTVSPTSLTFTPANWDTPQTVTVTGVDDWLDDGDQTYTVELAAAESDDTAYHGKDPDDVTVSNTDDDTAGVTVSAQPDLVTTESGGTTEFVVVLDSEPAADVTIAVSSSDTGEGTVSPTSLTFTPNNWNTVQTVTVTGVDDDVDDGDQTYKAELAAAESEDGNYEGLDPDDVPVRNTDNDAAGVTVSAQPALVTAEWGGTTEFAVVLDTEPAENVTIGVSSSDTGEGTVSPSSLTFTASNWNTPQTVTVTGVDDEVFDGLWGYRVELAAAESADTAYSGIDPDDLYVWNWDDDNVGVLTDALGTLVTTEWGGTAQLRVILKGRPDANVTIGVSSSDTSEGTVSPTSLTFTPSNWRTTQTVTVTGVDDSEVDGDKAYTVMLGAAVSADDRYSGLDPDDVPATNTDHGSVVTVAPQTLETTEAGGTATFTVALDSQPAQNVTIGVSSSNTDEGTVSPDTLTFTASNWSTAQTVTVTGVDDDVDDGDQAYTVALAAAVSTDGRYNGLDPDDVSGRNADDDTAGVRVVYADDLPRILLTSEEGRTDQFPVVLDSQPEADVTIAVSSSDETEGTVSPASLTFTPDNWSTQQTVTVTGVADQAGDGDQEYMVELAAAVSTDDNYDGLDPDDVRVWNLGGSGDPGITVAPQSDLLTTEWGGTSGFTVVLTTQPQGDVTIAVSSSDTSEATVSPDSLTFTDSNWDTAQTVTVTGVDDGEDDGDQAYTVVLGAAVSTDTTYDGIDTADVSAVNVDHRTFVRVSPTSGLETTEAGGTAQFTVVLGGPPAEEHHYVSTAVRSLNEDEGMVSPTSLTFTRDNWDTPQTVTVTGVDDSETDGAQSYTVELATVETNFNDFSGVNPADVSVRNLDDDAAAGVTVSPQTLATTEWGGTAQFTVVLDSQPTDNVTIGVSSSDTGEGTVSPASLTFTTADWDTAQTVTVTGQNDEAVDGDQTYAVELAAAASTDTRYNALDPDDVSATNTDHGSVVMVAPQTLATTEAGGTAQFTVALVGRPDANVTIGVSSDDTGEGTVSPTRLTFTPSNWRTTQTVTVTGVDDSEVDGDQTYTAVLAAAESTDDRYSGVDPDDVPVTNTDRGSVVTVAPQTLETTEAGGTAQFTVALDSAPTAEVTIGVSSSNTDEGTVSVSSLTFTPSNWNMAQTVTVTGVDDDVDDGDQAYTVALATAVSTDDRYSGLDPDDVAGRNTDDDTAGVRVVYADDLPRILLTSEEDRTDQFPVVLDSQPEADVTIAVSSSDTSEGTVSPTSLTFTPDNWNTQQTVTVTGVDDDVGDGDQEYMVELAAAVSTDANYDGLDPDDVRVWNLGDSNDPGITIDPQWTLLTTEWGGPSEFTVVLTTQPQGDVTIAVSSSDITEATVSPDSLTFTDSNWNTAQTVTVTGVDDGEDDGDQAYTVVLGAAVSTDTTYDGIDTADVSAVNVDHGTMVKVSPTSGLETTEWDGTAQFTVVLGGPPDADVTIGVSSSDPNEGTVSPESLTFTPLNGQTPQTVTVTGVDDDDPDGAQSYTVMLAEVQTTFQHLVGVNPPDVSVRNLDDDAAAGVTVSPQTLVTTEWGGTAQFTVVLDSQPTDNVTIGVSSSDTGEGTVSPASLRFTTADWDTVQTVTVTGQNDDVVDGDQTYTVELAAADSTDTRYNALDPDDVSATNTDHGSVVMVAPQTLATTEAGGTAQFTVALDSAPTADVTIGVSSSDISEGTVSVSSLTFTTANYGTAQTVTVTGVDDEEDDGDQAYTVELAAAASTDARYNDLDPDDVPGRNADDDGAAGVSVSAQRTLVTTEEGGTAEFTVVLNSEPAAGVTIGVSSSDTSEGRVSPASLPFTTANWDTPQTVTVTGQDDSETDGPGAYRVELASAVSADTSYEGMDPDDVRVWNLDDDGASGVTVSSTADLETTEAGGTATFTVVLDSESAADVTIGVSSSDTGEGTVSPASLTFTAINWDTPQTVTVTGVDDDVDDGAQAYKAELAAAVSTDARYNGLDPDDVLVRNTDDDTAGVTASPTSGLETTEEGRTDRFTVVLDTEPTDEVTIAVSSSDTSEGTVSPASLTFTASNWNTPQTVTVTGRDDAIVDGAQGYPVTLAARSEDDKYNGLNPGDVTVINYDDNTYAVKVDPLSRIVTTEAGGTATFTVVLDSRPAADTEVTTEVSSDDTSEGTVSVSSLTFTPDNWDTAVTVTGVDDDVDDGDQNYNVVLAPAASADGNYSGLDPDDARMKNTDNDTAGVTVVPASRLATTEGGGTAQFTVKLDSEPTHNVTIAVSSDDTSEGTVSVPSLTFTPDNWDTAQTVTVTGVDDEVDDGDQDYTVMLAAAVSDDGNYNNLDPDDVSVSNTDDDTAGVAVSPTTGLVTTEGGGTAQFTVKLNSQPTDEVTIAVSIGGDADEGTVSPDTLTFTPDNWNTEQTVTVTGVDDDDPDGARVYTVVLAPAVSEEDENYNGLDPDDVSVSNTDDEAAVGTGDAAGVTVSPTAGLETTEAGGTATFTVLLDSQPDASVTIAVSSSDTTEGTVSPTSLTFTAINWNAEQTVTVTGVDDNVADGAQGYAVVLAAASEGDDSYNSLDPDDVSVSNTDDDAAGVTVSPTADLETTEEGGTATFTVVAGQRAGGGGDDWGEQQRRRRGDGVASEPDVHAGQLEHGADGDGDGGERRRGRRRPGLHGDAGGGGE